MKTLLIIAATALGFLQALGAAVTNISAGGGHCLFLKSDGSLWGMGLNQSGQLGDGTSNSSNRPEQIISGRVMAIASGYNYSLFVKTNGSLWAMGNDYFGQLGDGKTSPDTSVVGSAIPEQILSSGVVSVAACFSKSLFIKSDGSLWGMGSINGATHTTPIQIVSSDVVAVATGESFALYVKSDGSLWGFGFDGWGQLGNGMSTSGTDTPQQIISSGVAACAAGGEHSLFLKSDGSLWGMGLNLSGQLGDGTYGTSDGLYASQSCTNIPEQIVAGNVTAIAADREGAGHSLFLKSDGSLWAMGDNGNGELGDGTTDSGNYKTNRPEQIVANNVVSISAGNGFSTFLKSDGSLWVMGGNYGAGLGNGFTNRSNVLFPEQIVPSPQPILTSSISFQTNLQFQATCQFGGNFYLLVGTNLTQPLNQWTPVWTNVIANRTNHIFRATLTNAVNSGGQGFYILQSD